MKRLRNTGKRIWREITLLSTELIIILLLFLGSAFVFATVVNAIFIEKKESFDHRVFKFLSPYVTDTNTSVMLFFTALGKHTFLIPANLLLIAYFLFIRKHKWFSIRVSAIAISSLCLMFLLKLSFNRPRPSIPVLTEVSGLSFPSGHALMSFAFYGLLIYIVWHEVKNRWLQWTLIIFFLLLIHVIGFSRVYLRVHYASDVLAGFAVGFIWLVLSLWVILRLEKRSLRKIAPAGPGDSIPES
jgi:membrane-associated phospholipid phosphatase